MKKYVAALLLVLVCSANMAYSASRPDTQPKTKIQGSLSGAKIKTPCEDARADKQGYIENLTRTTERIVECYGSEEADNTCHSGFLTFEYYYGYLRDASARVKQHCN